MKIPLKSGYGSHFAGIVTTRMSLNKRAIFSNGGFAKNLAGLVLALLHYTERSRFD